MKMQKPVIFVKTDLKINIWKIKTTVKLEIVVIIQRNIEVLCIVYVIENKVYLKKFLLVFLMDITMMIILSKKS